MDWIGLDGMGYLQTGPFLDHLAVIINRKDLTLTEYKDTIQDEGSTAPLKDFLDKKMDEIMYIFHSQFDHKV